MVGVLNEDEGGVGSTPSISRKLKMFWTDFVVAFEQLCFVFFSLAGVFFCADGAELGFLVGSAALATSA